MSESWSELLRVESGVGRGLVGLIRWWDGGLCSREDRLVQRGWVGSLAD